MPDMLRISNSAAPCPASLARQPDPCLSLWASQAAVRRCGLFETAYIYPMCCPCRIRPRLVRQPDPCLAPWAYGSISAPTSCR